MHKAASGLALFEYSLGTIAFKILGLSPAYSSVLRKSDWHLLLYPEPSLTSLTIRTRSCSVKFVLSQPFVPLNHPSCQSTDIYVVVLSLLCLCSKFIHCLLPLGLYNTFSALVPPATFFLLEPKFLAVTGEEVVSMETEEQVKLTRHKMKTVSSSSPILKNLGQQCLLKTFHCSKTTFIWLLRV